jgi:hypothetical protein
LSLTNKLALHALKTFFLPKGNSQAAGQTTPARFPPPGPGRLLAVGCWSWQCGQFCKARS